MKTIAFSVVALTVASVAAVAAELKSEQAAAAHLAELKAEYVRPTSIPFPDGNPYSKEKDELGKLLFFDRRLSQSEFISCATCHSPSYGWEDGIAVAIGHDFARAGRNTPTILNLAWGELFFWDGRASSLEEQAIGPIEAAGEMNLSHDVAVDRIASVPFYISRFEEVFPGEGVTIDTIAKAIATYERTIVSEKAPFDLWVEGDETAISSQAKLGFEVFNGKGKCSLCHVSWRFTDDGFHDIGVPSDDIGRGKVLPGIPVLEHAFKTPTLRNITERAPYMHDGSVASLREVVEFYDHGFIERESLDYNITKLNLTEEEKNALVVFMETLTSDDPAVEMPVIPRTIAKVGDF